MGKSIMQNVLCWDISSMSANVIQYQEFVISLAWKMALLFVKNVQGGQIQDFP